MTSADRVRHVLGQADGTLVHRHGMAQLLRFACVGVASTAVFTLLYLALRSTGMPAQAANVICQFVTAVANTAARPGRAASAGVRMRYGINSRGL